MNRQERPEVVRRCSSEPTVCLEYAGGSPTYTVETPYQTFDPDPGKAHRNHAVASSGQNSPTQRSRFDSNGTALPGLAESDNSDLRGISGTVRAGRPRHAGSARRSKP